MPCKGAPCPCARSHPAAHCPAAQPQYNACLALVTHQHPAWSALGRAASVPMTPSSPPGCCAQAYDPSISPYALEVLASAPGSVSACTRGWAVETMTPPPPGRQPGYTGLTARHNTTRLSGWSTALLNQLLTRGGKWSGGGSAALAHPHTHLPSAVMALPTTPTMLGHQPQPFVTCRALSQAQATSSSASALWTGTMWSQLMAGVQWSASAWRT